MKEHLDILGIGLQAILTAIQTDEVLRWISFGFTIFSVILNIAYNVWRWWRKSNEDGKISMDEVDELVDIVKDGSDTLKDITKEDNNDTRGNGEKTKWNWRELQKRKRENVKRFWRKIRMKRKRIRRS